MYYVFILFYNLSTLLQVMCEETYTSVTVPPKAMTCNAMFTVNKKPSCHYDSRLNCLLADYLVISDCCSIAWRDIGLNWGLRCTTGKETYI